MEYRGLFYLGKVTDLNENENRLFYSVEILTHGSLEVFPAVFPPGFPAFFPFLFPFLFPAFSSRDDPSVPGEMTPPAC